LVLGAGSTWLGIQHYRGTLTWWLRYVALDAQFFLPMWFGPVLLIGGLADAGAQLSPVLGVLLALPLIPLFPVGLMSILWLPDRLLPAWYLQWRAHGRHFTELPGRSTMVPGP
jgi:hypothetical protein